MLVPNRHGSSNSYRYGFQGQEKDDELKGEGNSLNYTFRLHDPRVGRFFAVDPLTSKYPHYTPYSFSGNKPIQYVELEGLEEGSTKIHTPINAIQSIDEEMINSLVDMSNSKKVNTNSLGWPRDPQYFWNEFKDSELGKKSLSNDNINLVKKGNSPKVDDVWNSAMSKYDLDGKVGEGIEHHHHNKGRTAYPRPKSKHTSVAWNNVLHNLEKRVGEIRQKGGHFSKLASERGTLLRGKLGGLLNIFNVADWLIDSPHSSRYMFGNGSKINRAYFDDNSGLYFEIKSIDKKGNMKLQFFKDYQRIDGEWRGILKVDKEEMYIKQSDDSYKKQGSNMS